MIREIAEQKVGGPERLEAALRRGACRSVTHKGVELFFFPTMAIGTTEEHKVTMKTGRSKTTTTEAYDAISELATNMGWSLASLSQATLEADRLFPFFTRAATGFCFYHPLFEQKSGRGGHEGVEEAVG